MAKITITMEVAEEFSDPDHETGLTDDGFNLVFGGIQDVGTEITIRRGDC